MIKKMHLEEQTRLLKQKNQSVNSKYLSIKGY